MPPRSRRLAVPGHPWRSYTTQNHEQSRYYRAHPPATPEIPVPVAGTADDDMTPLPDEGSPDLEREEAPPRRRPVGLYPMDHTIRRGAWPFGRDNTRDFMEHRRLVRQYENRAIRPIRATGLPPTQRQILRRNYTGAAGHAQVLDQDRMYHLANRIHQVRAYAANNPAYTGPLPPHPTGYVRDYPLMPYTG